MVSEGTSEPEGGARRDGELDDLPLIVGVGASAGGLEALELLLHGVPADSGLAFVIVQHLDPTRDDMLAELLQRTTNVVVTQAVDGVAVEPGHAYVIPPASDLVLSSGVLRLAPSAGVRGHRLPIDTLFASLARELGMRARAVVLSGMGSDGTVGLEAIKEAGGTTFAQEPSEAAFDPMPRSAIAAGVVDVVARADELAGLILTPGGATQARGGVAEGDPAAVDEIVAALNDATGRDFTPYKPNTLCRRIERRMSANGIETIEGYSAFLRSTPWEYDLLQRELLIGVTEFFRDPDAWGELEGTVLPAMLDEQSDGFEFRAWVPACSTGEEAYSLAIAFLEALDRREMTGRHRLQVFATDIEADSIERARQGLYPAAALERLPPGLVDRYFARDGDGFRISRSVREMLIFSTHDALHDPPFTRLHLLLCRNLLIYLKPEPQARLIRIFHFALAPGGFLMLGKSETVGTSSSLFAATAGGLSIYRRADTRRPVLEFSLPSRRQQLVRTGGGPPPGSAAAPALGPKALTDRRLLDGYAPVAVLVDAEGDILYISGRAGSYLEPATGHANLNIHAMAREGLQLVLSSALRTAASQDAPVRLKNVLVKGDGGGISAVDVSVEAVRESGEWGGKLLVVFEDARVASGPVAEPVAVVEGGTMARDLQMSHDEQRLLRAEAQQNREAFQSANEELQSANEELQSANEELMASKEEMQSLNEELQTVNAELHSKLDDLALVHNDMTNLLNGIELAIVFLDAGLCVRRFTPYATRLFRLLPHDIGRPLSDIATELEYPELTDDIRAVASSGVYRETTVPATGGRWFDLRIVPYRTRDGVSDGVVMTFADVTRAKVLEARLRELAGDQQ